jgi:hypothetical protein
VLEVLGSEAHLEAQWIGFGKAGDASKDVAPGRWGVPDVVGGGGVDDVSGGGVAGVVGKGRGEDEGHPAGRGPAGAVHLHEDRSRIGVHVGEEAAKSELVEAEEATRLQDGSAGSNAMKALGLGEDGERRRRRSVAAELALAPQAATPSAIGAVGDNHEGSTRLSTRDTEVGVGDDRGVEGRRGMSKGKVASGGVIDGKRRSEDGGEEGVLVA